MTTNTPLALSSKCDLPPGGDWIYEMFLSQNNQVIQRASDCSFSFFIWSLKALPALINIFPSSSFVQEINFIYWLDAFVKASLPDSPGWGRSPLVTLISFVLFSSFLQVCDFFSSLLEQCWKGFESLFYCHSIPPNTVLPLFFLYPSGMLAACYFKKSRGTRLFEERLLSVCE